MEQERQAPGRLQSARQAPVGPAAADAKGGTAAGADRLSIPRGATDSHVHLFEPEPFRYADARAYTPPPASLRDLERFRGGMGIDRLVLVQPSIYGTDNDCLLHGLREIGREIARGIAVVDPGTVSDARLNALSAAGVVGVRVNLRTEGRGGAREAIDAVSAATRRVADHGMAVQIYVDLPLVEALADTILASPVPVILDHFGGVQASEGLHQPGLSTLLRLLGRGNIWIKLSGAYRASSAGPAYDDLGVIARRLVAENADRLVWASDWPHTGGGAERLGRSPTDVEPFREVDDAQLLSLLGLWTSDVETQRKILVDNPAALFRF